MKNTAQEPLRVEVDANLWSHDSYRYEIRQKYVGRAVVYVAKPGTTEGTIYDAGSVIYREDA